MDQAIYHKMSTVAGELIVIAVHVDDCMITASQLRLVEDFEAGLSKHVEVTDLGELHWMLGIEVKQDCAAGCYVTVGTFTRRGLSRLSRH